MKPSTSLRGAQRFPMTSKQGNKDYYKGTRQSFAPGAGVRTGAPGVHVTRGKYKLLDDKVRVFVAPHKEVMEHTKLRPYVDHRHFSPKSTALPDPYSAFSIFQRHARHISTTHPDLRSRWQKIIDERRSKKTDKVDRIGVDHEPALQIISGELEAEAESSVMDESGPSSLASSSSSTLAPAAAAVTSASPSSSPTGSSSSSSSSSGIDPNVKWDDRELYEDPDRLLEDWTNPSDIDAVPLPTPISQMTLEELDALHRSDPPADEWTSAQEDRYQQLKWENLVKPPLGTTNPMYWDHWKMLSEEQKEAYKMTGRRLWWDVCAQEIRAKAGV